MTLVSVVIPVRDGERYLAEAIESVLADASAALEVIVVDDGSTDGSAEIACSYAPAVRVVAGESRGIGAARNRGIAAASGTHIAFLDADDRLAPDGIGVRLAAFERAPETDLAWGLLRCFVSPDLPQHEAARLVCPEGPQPGRLPGGMLATRAAFERVGPFAEHLRVGEFVDWAARAREAALVEAETGEVVFWRRLHADNHGRRNRDAAGDYLRVVKAALDRRRAEGSA